MKTERAEIREIVKRILEKNYRKQKTNKQTKKVIFDCISSITIKRRNKLLLSSILSHRTINRKEINHVSDIKTS